jgi:hypothetical protein
MKTSVVIVGLAGAALVSSLLLESDAKEPRASGAFPAKQPIEKPTDRRLSAAMERLYDVWNPREDRGNDFFSNFKYSRLEGFSREPNVSRRDPSKVIRVDGTYYVYYTCRRTEAPPSGTAKATDTVPSRDWDLAEVRYATSKDGVNFQVKALLQVPPIAPGPFVPDAFVDNGDGRGITWGLCHINPDGGGSMNESILARFDCDLSRDTDVAYFKRNNLRFDEHTYFQRVLALPEYMKKRIIESSRE